MAVPLLQVTRLEEFSPSSIETVGDRDVVPYLGDILPLVDLEGRWLDSGRRWNSPRAASSVGLQALVYSRHDAKIGIIVDQILDTIETSLINLRPSTRPGVTGSLILDGRVTEILDLDAICAGLIPSTTVIAATRPVAEAAA
jgi:two-component system chemotaxis sensor kinase CheA